MRKVLGVLLIILAIEFLISCVIYTCLESKELFWETFLLMHKVLGCILVFIFIFALGIGLVSSNEKDENKVE